MPKYSVQLATLVSEAPDGDEWVHEIKFDGYRMLCYFQDGEARFVSRNDKDWTGKFRNLATEIAGLPITSAVIDGEVMLLDKEGRSSFQLLQNAFKASAPAPFLFYAFDFRRQRLLTPELSSPSTHGTLCHESKTCFP